MSMNDVHAPDRVRCPSCGAKNPPDAQWCGQCLTRFGAPPPPPPAPAQAAPAAAPAAPAPAPPVPPAPKAPGEQAAPGSAEGGVARSYGSDQAGITGSFRSTEAGVLWRCTSCDTENRLEEPACVVCGTGFGEALRPPTPPRVHRDPGTTAMISLFFPGAGHAYLGMWPQAVARAVVSVWVVAMALFFAVGGKGGAMPMAILYGLVAFGLWMVAAHDAFREASDQPRQVLLYGRRFTYLVLGLLVLLMGSMFLTAFSSR